MKLGSIIGLVICCILLIAGISLCTAGYVSARNSGQYLFTQTNENGTFFISDIDDSSTTAIKLDVADAKIRIIGGADRSRIEFINYNPNYYVLTSTAKIINFEEVESFSSMLKIWEKGFSFKGLRYVFDFNDYGNSDSNRSKEINVYVTDMSSLNTVDITAENADITAENIHIPGNITVHTESGSISLSNVSSDKAVTLYCKEGNISLDNSSASTLTLSAESSNALLTSSTFMSAELTVSAGRVDFYSPVSYTGEKLSISSETGGILLNGSPVNGSTYSTSAEGAERSLKIKTVSAGINFEFPEDEDDPDGETVDETEAN